MDEQERSFQEEVDRQREFSEVDGDLWRKIDRIRLEQRGEPGTGSPEDIAKSVERLVDRLVRELSPAEIGQIIRDWLPEHPSRR